MGSSHSSGPRLLHDIWIFAGISTVVVILRVLAKFRIKKFGWDDILMISGLCLSLVGSAIITVAVQNGYGRSIEVVSDASKVIMYDYLGQTFGISGGVAGRVAFIVFISGILGTNKGYRMILWALAGAQVVINLLFILIIFLQCPGHASAIWSQSHDSSQCWDLRIQTYYGYFEGAFNSATDLYLAAFSTFVFWNLQLRVHVRIGLIALLGLGIFAMVASIVKTVQLHILANANNNPTMATVNLERWLYIETYIVILTASIPCLRSLIPSNKQHTNSRSMHTISPPFADSAVSSFPSRARGSLASRKGVARIGRNNFSRIESQDEIALAETGDMDTLAFYDKQSAVSDVTESTGSVKGL